MRNLSEMALDTHLCSLVVKERTSSARGDWLWWLRGARQLCFLMCSSLGRETARRLMSFCHWLIGRPHVVVGSWKCTCTYVTVCMTIHAICSYGMHTLATITQLVAWNSEPPPLGPSWSSPPYFVAVSNIHFKQMWEEVLRAKRAALLVVINNL